MESSHIELSIFLFDLLKLLKHNETDTDHTLIEHFTIY